MIPALRSQRQEDPGMFQASLIYTAPASNKQRNQQVRGVAQLLDFLPRVYKILGLIFTSTSARLGCQMPNSQHSRGGDDKIPITATI